MNMRWTGKVVGGSIGLMAFGPIGAAIGALVGHQFDNAVDDGERLNGPEGAFTPIETAEQFFLATFRVMGHLAKADGRVSEQEIAAARGVMTALRLDGHQVAAAINEFTRGKHSSFNVMDELRPPRPRLRRAAGPRTHLRRDPGALLCSPATTSKARCESI